MKIVTGKPISPGYAQGRAVILAAVRPEIAKTQIHPDRIDTELARQHETYRQIAASLDGLPLVIRTLDLGGDKWPAFLKPKFEANPNLGVRGLRFSLLAAEDLFRTQICAVLHAATEHEVRIMLPMVLGRADLQQAISIIQNVAQKEGIANLPPIGTLIETPAAVFAIDEIMASSDFVSIGTNDLTQFILAADRNALAMIDDYTVLHPSVLRAVHRVIEAANAAGKPAAVCGESAADPGVACLLVGLGARRLSMSPVSAALVRYALRASHLDSLETLARAALNSDSAQTVSTLVTDALRRICPECHSDAVYGLTPCRLLFQISTTQSGRKSGVRAFGA